MTQLLAPEAPKGKPADFEALLVRLRSQDPAVRKAAVTALGVKDNVRAVPYLGGLLMQVKETQDLRVAAALALGRVQNWRTAVYLRHSIKDPAKEIRFASALALGKSKATEAVPLLSAALEGDGEWWVRFAAAVGLGDTHNPSAIPALTRACAEETEWQVRMQAVRSLGHMGCMDAARALSASLHDPDPGVRAAAAMAMGEIGGLETMNIIAAALHDEKDDFPRQVMSETIKKLLARP